MGKRKGRGGSDDVRRARHERREKARKERQSQRREQQLATPPGVPRFITEFGCDLLANCGPQFFCTWHIPAADAEAMKKAGRTPPGGIAGALLLDTGATRTCIALKTATDLGLQPRRMQDGFGAGGKHSNPVFLARLEIKIIDLETKGRHVFAWEQEVEGIPELHNFAAPLEWEGRTVPVSGLLGRDILKHARIHYDGPAGRLRFEFDVTSLRRQPSR
jgi:hypothetical protein